MASVDMIFGATPCVKFRVGHMIVPVPVNLAVPVHSLRLLASLTTGVDVIFIGLLYNGIPLPTYGSAGAAGVRVGSEILVFFHSAAWFRYMDVLARKGCNPAARIFAGFVEAAGPQEDKVTTKAHAFWLGARYNVHTAPFIVLRVNGVLGSVPFHKDTTVHNVRLVASQWSHVPEQFILLTSVDRVLPCRGLLTTARITAFSVLDVGCNYLAMWRFMQREVA